LLKGIIKTPAPTEAVLKILIVLVVRIGLLGVNSFLGIGLGVDAQIAGTRSWESRGAAVAGKVALVEDLDESVVAVALDRAGIADARRIVGIGRVFGRGKTGETGKYSLAQRAKGFRAVLNALEGEGEGSVEATEEDSRKERSYIGKSFARISFQLHLIANEVGRSLRI